VPYLSEKNIFTLKIPSLSLFNVKWKDRYQIMYELKHEFKSAGLTNGKDYAFLPLVEKDEIRVYFEDCSYTSYFALKMLSHENEKTNHS